MRIHLQDPDNRDDMGASYEFTGTVERAITYLDGPVRKDLRPGAVVAVEALDRAIQKLREGDLKAAIPAARRVGVYLSRVGGEHG